MKKIFALLCCLSASLHFVSAGTTVLYKQDFGTTNGGTTLAAVGWGQVLPPSGYSGIYAQGGAVDQVSGAPLPSSTLYFGGNAGRGIFYTTAGMGSGTGGDSSFTSINPVNYTNLNFSLESQYSYQGSFVKSYFGVYVGGIWYVSTNQPFSSGGTPGPAFYPSSITYNSDPTNWNILTLATVAIGAHPGSALSGSIDGIGVIQVLTNSGSWDYNNFLVTSISNVGVTAPSLTAAPLGQTNYAGAGVSFAVAASGTQPFTYYWKKNGAPISNGGNITGADTATLNIANISGTDVASYSVIVSNAGGYFDTSTNSTASLGVVSVPSDYLYAETFPFVGPLPVGFPLGVVGWSNSIPDNLSRLYQIGTGSGDGAFYAYEGSPMTNVFFANTTSDTGVSGLPFAAINPSSHTFVSFAVDVAPTYQPNNVTAYIAVQMGDGSWYVNQTPLSVDTSLASTTFVTYGQQFSASAAEWNTLTISGTSGAIGAQAASNLTGNIIGAGLVFVYAGTGGNFNIDNFRITTDATPPTAPLITSLPYSQTAYVGAGVSFTVAATGTRPLNYSWQRNSVTLSDGGKISGSTSNVLTIANVSSADQGAYVAFVYNTAGSDESDFYINTALTVNNPPSGLLYAETFPFIGPGTVNEPIGNVGWANTLAGTQNRLSQNFSGDGFGFATESGPATTAFLGSTANDPGVSGLPFPSINPTLYPSLTFSVDIAPAATPANVTAYIAVEIGTNWYVSSSSLPVATGSATPTFSTYTQVFNPAATSWKDLTLVAGNGATIGSQVGSSLSGNIIGAGLVFVHTGTGGTFNFDNFLITGTATGLGQVTVTGVTANTISLSWNGAPNIRLQSTTSLNSPAVWNDVPNTTGQSSATVTTTGQQQIFFRLKQ